MPPIRASRLANPAALLVGTVAPAALTERGQRQTRKGALPRASGRAASPEPRTASAELVAPGPHPDPGVDAAAQDRCRLSSERRAAHLAQVARRLHRGAELMEAFRDALVRARAEILAALPA